MGHMGKIIIIIIFLAAFPDTKVSITEKWNALGNLLHSLIKSSHLKLLHAFHLPQTTKRKWFIQTHLISINLIGCALQFEFKYMFKSNQFCEFVYYREFYSEDPAA